MLSKPKIDRKEERREKSGNNNRCFAAADENVDDGLLSLQILFFLTMTDEDPRLAPALELSLLNVLF